MDKSFEKQGFKHIAYVTSDFSWKEDMQELQGDLFWFPSLALEQFSDQAKREVIHAHIKNIMVMLEENGENNNKQKVLIIMSSMILTCA